MHYSTTVGADLAKNVTQVSVVSPQGKELLNRSFSCRKFAEFLGKQKPSLVACRRAAWARSAHHSSQGCGAVSAGAQDR